VRKHASLFLIRVAGASHFSIAPVFGQLPDFKKKSYGKFIQDYRIVIYFRNPGRIPRNRDPNTAL
jgi:hypothetical protein